MLQAVAVMLMVWHHLFAFPERIAVPYVLVLDGLFHLETLMSYFGKICIAIFAFVSGYGMRKMTLTVGGIGIIENYKRVFRQLLKFFGRYWMVFFVFIPVGYVLKVYPFDIRSFLYGVVGASAYNEEWWYITCYIQALVAFPVMTLLFDCLQKHASVCVRILIGILIGALLFFKQDLFLHGWVMVLVCFTVGMFFVSNDIFETMYRLLPKKSWVRFWAGIALLGAVLLLRFAGVPDYVNVGWFIFSVMVILKTEFVKKLLYPVLMFVGKYSTYIWLTHTFFGYYYFQKLTFFPRYSWLIFLWCMVLSITSGVILEGLLGLICKGFKRLLQKSPNS